MNSKCNKKVSIIIPVYNKEKYIEKCIESIINQSYSNIEILLINDGSTDNSDIICKKYIFKNNVKYISIDNKGVSNARNLGIKNSTGDYIVFVDADDYVDEFYIESLCEFNYDLVVEGYFKEKNEIKEKCIINNGIYSKDDILTLLKQKEITNIFSVPYLKLFKISIIKENNINFNTSLNFGEDFDFVLRYIKNVKRPVLIKEESHYFNRIEADGLSRKAIPNIWSQMSIVFDTICSLYDQECDRDYYFLRFLKISLLNSYYKKYFEFKNGFKEICKSQYFKKVKLRSFKICSIDWTILLLFKIRFNFIAFIIFGLKRR